jgi:hypothetical protein
MTRILFALAFGLACLARPAAAQEPIAVPAAPAPVQEVMPVPESLPAPLPADSNPHPAAGHPAPAHVEECPAYEPCCEDGKKWKKGKRYCVPEHTTIKKIHVEYRCKEDEVCKNRCTLCGMLGGLFRFKKKCGDCCEDAGCDDCDDCDKCGKVRCRRRLVKRFVTEECPGTKCVPPKDCCEEVVVPCPAVPPAK